MPFHLSNDAFGTVAISVALVCEIETASLEGCLESVGVTDEKYSVVNACFPRNFRRTISGSSVLYAEKRRIWRKALVSGPTAFTEVCSRAAHQIATRSGDGVQPVPLIVDANHALAERTVIRRFAAIGLEIGLSHPIVDGFARTLAPNYQKQRYYLKVIFLALPFTAVDGFQDAIPSFQII